MPRLMSSSRPAAFRRGAGGEPQIGGRDGFRVTPGHFEQGHDAGTGLSGADALQALVHQDPVDLVQRHHVGDGAQGHQIQQLAQIGFGCAWANQPGSRSLRPQGHQHVEHHADAGQGRLGNSSPGRLGLTMASAAGSSAPGRW